MSSTGRREAVTLLELRGPRGCRCVDHLARVCLAPHAPLTHDAADIACSPAASAPPPESVAGPCHSRVLTLACCMPLRRHPQRALAQARDACVCDDGVGVAAMLSAAQGCVCWGVRCGVAVACVCVCVLCARARRRAPFPRAGIRAPAPPTHALPRAAGYRAVAASPAPGQGLSRPALPEMFHTIKGVLNATGICDHAPARTNQISCDNYAHELKAPSGHAGHGHART